jgi:hypothetical protein
MLEEIINNDMNRKLVLFCLILFIGCSNKQAGNQNMNERFLNFIVLFESIKLPCFIIGDKDVFDFDDSILNNSLDLVPNPKLKPINEFEFIKSKYPINKSNIYYGVFEKRINNLFLVCIKQDNSETEKYRLMLNLFDLDGNLLDTVYIAGRSMPEFRRYCKITTDLRIKTYYYDSIKDDLKNNDGNFYAIEKSREYVISGEGKFLLTKENNDWDYFTMWGERNIVARVDTIDGRYRFNIK